VPRPSGSLPAVSIHHLRLRDGQNVRLAGLRPDTGDQRRGRHGLWFPSDARDSLHCGGRNCIGEGSPCSKEAPATTFLYQKEPELVVNKRRSEHLNRTRFLWTPSSLILASTKEGGHGEETGPRSKSVTEPDRAGAPRARLTRPGVGRGCFPTSYRVYRMGYGLVQQLFAGDDVLDGERAQEVVADAVGEDIVFFEAAGLQDEAVPVA